MSVSNFLRQADEREAGFSLLEIMVALLIMSLAVGVVGPSLLYSPQQRAHDRLVDGLEQMLRSERNAADRAGGLTGVRFDEGQRKFIASSGDALTVYDRLTVRVTAAETARVDNGDVSVLFFPSGRSSGGEIEVRSRGRATTINADWLTSKLEIREGRVGDDT